MVANISKLATDSSIAQNLVKQSLTVYFYLTHHWTVRVFDEVQDAFTRYPFLNAAILHFYSHNDSMCDISSIEDIIKYQKEHGYQVFSHDWPVSAHAQHMVRHPIEYKSSLAQFLMKIDPGNTLLVGSRL